MMITRYVIDTYILALLAVWGVTIVFEDEEMKEEALERVNRLFKILTN
jgi:hypothetical protein